MAADGEQETLTDASERLIRALDLLESKLEAAAARLGDTESAVTDELATTLERQAKLEAAIDDVSRTIAAVAEDVRAALGD